MQDRTWTSWNGRIRHDYAKLHRPQNEEELRSLVTEAKSLRAFGTGKSSADICAGADILLDMGGYRSVLSVDRELKQVTVQSGTRLSELVGALEAEGLSLPALPDIDDITVGGAVATGTHGTGRDAASLSDYLVGFRLVLADGSVREVGAARPLSAEDRDCLDAARVSLGLLGVFSTLTFQAQDLFKLAVTEEAVRDSYWLAAWPELLERHEFLRLIWLPHTGYGYLVTGDRYGPGREPFAPLPPPAFNKNRRSVSAALYKVSSRLPLLTVPANRLLKGLFFSGRVRSLGSLYETTVTKSRSGVMELAEWTVPASRFGPCFAELRKRLNSLTNPAFAHIPMDVRFIRKSSGWLANSWEEDSVTVGCVSRTPGQAERYAAFGLVEKVFLAHGGRPHWAKRFAAAYPELKPLYPRLDDFIGLRRKTDPDGKFLNPYLKKIFS